MRPFRIALATALLAASSVAVAQTSPGDMTVNVPFPFVVEGQPLPAGHYIVKAMDSGCLRIFNSKTAGAVVQTHAALRSVSDGSKLVFRCYEGACFLSGAWITGNTTGRELFRSHAEQVLLQRNAEMRLAVVRPLN